MGAGAAVGQRKWVDIHAGLLIRFSSSRLDLVISYSFIACDYVVPPPESQHAMLRCTPASLHPNARHRKRNKSRGSYSTTSSLPSLAAFGRRRVTTCSVRRCAPLAAPLRWCASSSTTRRRCCASWISSTGRATTACARTRSSAAITSRIVRTTTRTTRWSATSRSWSRS